MNTYRPGRDSKQPQGDTQSLQTKQNNQKWPKISQKDPNDYIMTQEQLQGDVKPPHSVCVSSVERRWGPLFCADHCFKEFIWVWKLQSCLLCFSVDGWRWRLLKMMHRFSSCLALINLNLSNPNIKVRSTHLSDCIRLVWVTMTSSVMDNALSIALICHQICFALTPSLFSVAQSSSCVTFSNRSTSSSVRAEKSLLSLFAILVVFPESRQSEPCLQQNTHHVLSLHDGHVTRVFRRVCMRDACS